ncbi:O-succinylhomoserine sulfhydrylase [Ancylobacter novellus DSM 506]|uniref:O-succinylhomoserine sulfhydrylase n=1 Tax=Ancylobacter novellus (strain ATCC 8093 / DSM 506 / JCM 20403 / CCM 1077 / IAM 12100 / NBRC 12443 / NCIMB 10456) TaxID=639283 RepID=D7A3W5_ANCN5|nr:O-succinylhomoserine sulfhydrylase [Ancylobacter novellus]ADH91742.1 O-succinylhomoserine sulfhydrylase [Ancylobacter novellus DSM 506]
MTAEPKLTPAEIAQLRPDTRLVHGGILRSPFGETSEALFLTQGYVYETAEQAEARFKGEDAGFIYTRYSNPTAAMFEGRLALLEGAEVCRSTASGMAAVTAALLCQLKAGDHVVAARALFGSCRYVVEELLPRFGVTSTLVDGTDIAAWKAAVRPETKVFFLESPTNPTLELIDIAAVAQVSKVAGACLIVDNVFATPMLQSPLQLGADVVVYSATKHIDGQGRCLAGAVLCSEKFLTDHLQTFLRQTGPSVSPFNAWVMLKGLETLPLRVERSQASAATLADRIADLPGITKVIYPYRADHPQHELAKRQMRGGGTLVTFEVEGGKAGAFRFLNGLKVARISNNLGDAKSLITHPATTTHQRFTPEARAQMGISDGMVRLSVGLEHVDDLTDDVARALRG